MIQTDVFSPIKPSHARASSPLRGQPIPKDYADPEQLVPRLPMPFRMIDRVLKELIEDVLDVVAEDKTDEDTGPVMPPSFVVPKVSDALCVHSSLDGRFMYVGTSTGKIHVVNAMRGLIADTIEVHGIIRNISSNSEIVSVCTDTHTVFFTSLKYPPFLKPHAVTTLEEGGLVAKLAKDSSYAAVTLVSKRVDVFKIPPKPEIEEIEPLEPHPEHPEKPMDQSLDGGGRHSPRGDKKEDQAPPAPPSTAPLHVATRVLSVPCKDAALGMPVVFFSYGPKPRTIGENTALECRYITVLQKGTTSMSKYKTSSFQPPSDEDAQTPEVTPDVVLRTPHSITAADMDSTSAMVCTGLRNGSAVLWDNVFDTHKHALQRHLAGAVASCAFVEYASARPPRLMTASEAGTVFEYDIKSGDLVRTVASLPKPLLGLFVTGIPVVVTVDAAYEIRVYNVDSVEKSECVGTVSIPKRGEMTEKSSDSIGSGKNLTEGLTRTSSAKSTSSVRSKAGKAKPESPPPPDGEWLLDFGASDHIGELIPFIRRLVVPPPVAEISDDIPTNPVKDPKPKHKQNQDEEDKEDKEEEMQEEEAEGEGESVVFGCKLLHLLGAAFPQLSTSAQHTSFIQSTISETYWQLTEGGGFGHSAVTDRYLRDAHASIQKPHSAQATPRNSISRGGHHAKSPGKAGTGGLGMLSLDDLPESPDRTTPSQSASKFKASQGHFGAHKDTLKETAVQVVVAGSVVGALSSANVARAGGRAGLGTSVHGGSQAGGSRAGSVRGGSRAGSVRGSKKGPGSRTGSEKSFKTYVPPEEKPTFANTNFFDPVDVVMRELHQRAGERNKRRVTLKKRNEELLTSTLTEKQK